MLQNGNVVMYKIPQNPKCSGSPFFNRIHSFPEIFNILANRFLNFSLNHICSDIFLYFTF